MAWLHQSDPDSGAPSACLDAASGLARSRAPEPPSGQASMDAAAPGARTVLPRPRRCSLEGGIGDGRRGCNPGARAADQVQGPVREDLLDHRPLDDRRDELQLPAARPEEARGLHAALEEGVAPVLDELRRLGLAAGFGVGDEAGRVLLHQAGRRRPTVALGRRAEGVRVSLSASVGLHAKRSRLRLRPWPPRVRHGRPLSLSPVRRRLHVAAGRDGRRSVASARNVRPAVRRAHPSQRRPQPAATTPSRCRPSSRARSTPTRCCTSSGARP